MWPSINGRLNIPWNGRVRASEYEIHPFDLHYKDLEEGSRQFNTELKQLWYIKPELEPLLVQKGKIDWEPTVRPVKRGLTLCDGE